MIVLAIVGVYDLVVAQFLPPSWQERFPPLVSWLPEWSWSVWGVIGIGILLVAVLEGAYRVSTRVKKEESNRIDDTIHHLESKYLTVAGKAVDMATVLYATADSFIEGMVLHEMRQTIENAFQGELETGPRDFSASLVYESIIYPKRYEDKGPGGFTVTDTYEVTRPWVEYYLSDFGAQVVNELRRRNQRRKQPRPASQSETDSNEP